MYHLIFFSLKKITLLRTVSGDFFFLKNKNTIGFRIPMFIFGTKESVWKSGNVLLRSDLELLLYNWKFLIRLKDKNVCVLSHEFFKFIHIQVYISIICVWRVFKRVLNYFLHFKASNYHNLYFFLYNSKKFNFDFIFKNKVFFQLKTANMKSTNKVNPDLDNERRKADIDVEKMKLFLGELTYSSLENYNQIQIYSRNKWI